MAKGMFKPLNPKKYLGDISKIRFLSSWELRFLIFCDSNPNILQYGSEEFKIPYFHPIKKTIDGKPKLCHYYPDFIIKYKNSNGHILTEVIEIKPHSQTIASKKTTTYDKVQLIINNAKWTAANAFCKSHNIKFRVVTEKDLFLK
jgi:hypothetical protein